jgi:hypothetical protein
MTTTTRIAKYWRQNTCCAVKLIKRAPAEADAPYRFGGSLSEAAV